MKDFYNDYRKKTMTAEEAASLVEDGDRIEMGFGAIFPVEFDRALAARAGDFSHVVIRNGVLSNSSEVLKAGAPFEWQTWHASSDVRRKMEAGSACHIPIRYSELPRYIDENLITDVVVIPTGAMDRHGYFNFGLDASHFLEEAGRARCVLVEVNPAQPRVHSKSGGVIHISEVDGIIESEPHSVAILPERDYGEVDAQIAERVVALIEDGSTLQLGIGALPGAVGEAITKSKLKDLGVHTEMYVDSFMHMTLAGKINGSKKTLDVGRQVFTFLAGSEALYDFAEENPSLMAAEVDYVNAPSVIGAQRRMVSINTALHVNLRGEVSSESVGLRHISGAGGQLDFALGSYLSPGGKGIICLHSSHVDRSGRRSSNIVPDFERGTIVTMPAPTTHYVVTEYGAVNLKGKSTAERARALTSIAHPDFREELKDVARARGVWKD